MMINCPRPKGRGKGAANGNNFLSLFYFQPLILQSTLTNPIMNELIDRLVNEAKLTPEQAHKAVETVANFVKDRFPMLGGAVDQVFGAGNKSDE
ncbi:MAG: hypothetical protein JWQ30_2210 [Sediminibacterium sp.]|nr:hypothetical protein [Sediminibacterium sp.]